MSVELASVGGRGYWDATAASCARTPLGPDGAFWMACIARIGLGFCDTVVTRFIPYSGFVPSPRSSADRASDF
jgi:hypothetical protein